MQKPGFDGPGSLRSLFDSAFCPMDYRLATNCYPWGVLGFEHVSLPGIDVFRDWGLGARKVARTRKHILENPSSDFIISVPLKTYVSISQMGASVRCEPGSLVIFSTARPFSAEVAAIRANESFVQLLGKISGSLMRKLVPELDECPPLVIDLKSGDGAIMKGLLELLLSDGKALSPGQAAEFANLLIHMVACVVKNAPTLETSQAGVSSYVRVQEEAKAFILRNLSNPDLDTRLVATHCKVSERYLHAAFNSSSLRVGACIREERLQQCRAALCNPTLHHRSIEEIASTWGFFDQGSFSRAYKARFGLCPREERKAAIKRGILPHQGRLAATA